MENRQPYIPASSLDVVAKGTPDEGKHIWFDKVRTSERYWINRARKNPIDFIIYMTDGEKPPASHHSKWLRAIFDKNIQHLIIEAFPGSAKTTSVIYSLAFVIGNHPELTHILCSVSEEQAKQRLSELREIIESPRYQNVFPHIHIDYKRPNNATMFNIWSSRWPGSDKEIDYPTFRMMITRFGEPRDHTVFAAGVTSKSVTGKRVSGWIVVDDPHNETNSSTPEQRAKVTSSIKKELMSRFSPRSPYTKIIIIMTPWAEDDCAGQLSEDIRGDGQKVWAFLKTPIRDEETGQLAWPEIFNEVIVKDIEENRGAIVFDLMYMLNPIAMAGKKITLDMLRNPLPIPLPTMKEMIITVDSAESEGLRSDYTVFHLLGRDEAKNFNCYLLDTERFQEEQISIRVDKLIDFADACIMTFGRFNKIIFEPDAKAEMQLLQQKRPDLACEIIQIKGDKELRFKPVAGFIQQGRMFFNTKNGFYHVVCSELLGFPKAKHDDCVDPLSLAFQQLGWTTKLLNAGMVIIKSHYAL